MTDPEDYLSDFVQVTPAVAVSGITLLGIPLHEWVYILTIVYTLVCIASVIKKHWIDPWLNNKNKKVEDGRSKEKD